MIIFFESGRLGNQLFQYCAMRKFQPNGAILAIGMDDLKRCFSGVELANDSWIGWAIERIIRRLGKLRISTATKWRLLSLVEEVKTENAIDFQVTKGFFSSVFYFKAGYYQSETVVQRIVMDQICLGEDYIREARQFLSTLPCAPQDCFFVHIRRGDYIGWPSSEAPAVVPLSWYCVQMRRIRDANPQAHFVLISDDHPYAEEFFSQYQDVVIHKGNLVTDFAVMTECHGGGVLSASSYSWWGGYFVNQKNPNARLIAPLYWGGHRSGSWFPSHIQTSWLQYADVERFQPTR